MEHQETWTTHREMTQLNKGNERRPRNRGRTLHLLMALLPLAAVNPLFAENPAPQVPQKTSAAGAQMQQNILDSLNKSEAALLKKKEAGSLTDQEKAVLESLSRAKNSIGDMNAADLEALAKIAAGGAITLNPGAEAAGAKPITITQKDLERAQADAVKFSKEAEAWVSKPENQGLMTASGVGSTASGGSGASWRTASGVDSGSGDSSDREVTVVVVNNDSQTPAVGSETTETDGALTNGLDAVDFEILHWDFGGFKPSSHCERSAPQLSGLKMKRDGLSFKYVEDLSSWGLAYETADALACLFVCDKDGKWVGGKFDWISSSRRTRDFKNVYSGYNDWSLANVPNPCPAAFVIVSKDGKKRSNVISGMWQR